MKWIVMLLVVGCGTAATTSTHRDTLDTIPRAAAQALERLAAGAKIERVAREREGGVELYEATWQVNGLEREAAVTASGEVVELEEEVESANVPALVRAAAITRLPGAQSIKFVKLQSGNYEAEAMIDGRESDVTLAPDGREVGDNDDDDGDDDGDDD